jgi:MFS family permease
VLYPEYAAAWSLPAVVTTSVFGAYPAALLIVLLLFGGVSDVIGRRRAMLLGVALLAVAAIVFALAPNVGWLFAGRILQGVGTGFALGAASAALVENNPTGNPRVASTLTTVSTAAGLTLALVVSGALAQYAPLPLVLSYVVLAVLCAVAAVAVWRTPVDAPSGTEGIRRAGGASTAGGTVSERSAWRPAALRLPRGILVPFLAAALSVATAYSMGAVFLSLGAQMARELTGTTDLLVIGALLGISSVAIGLTALFLRAVPAHAAIITGGLVVLASLGLMAWSAASGSLGLFLAWCVVGGVGYSFAFSGGLALVTRVAPGAHRGATLSLVYLVAYLLQASTAVGAGALATAMGLGPAIDVMAPILALLATAALVLAAIDRAAGRRGVVRALSDSTRPEPRPL